MPPDPRIDAVKSRLSAAGVPVRSLYPGWGECWGARGGSGRNVTFPARSYSVNGERRTFALLRPISNTTEPNIALRDAILEAYDASIEPPNPAREGWGQARRAR